MKAEISDQIYQAYEGISVFYLFSDPSFSTQVCLVSVTWTAAFKTCKKLGIYDKGTRERPQKA